jgi:hypothetical protein
LSLKGTMDKRNLWLNAGKLVGNLPLSFFIILFSFEAALVLLNILPTPSVTINRWVYLDDESNLPTWFSSAQLLLTSLTCLLAWKIDFVSGWKRLGWLCMAAMFGYLSVDETSTLHERFGAAATKQFEWTVWGDAFWLLVFSPFALLAIFLILSVIWTKLRSDRTAFMLALAALSMWICSLGLESLVKWISWAGVAEADILNKVSMLCEEFFEMSGATLFWMSAVLWIRKQSTEVLL